MSAPTTVHPLHMRVCRVSIPISTPATSPLPTSSMATEMPSSPTNHNPVPNPTYKVLSTPSTMAITKVGGGRRRKSSARVAEPPSPDPQLDGDGDEDESYLCDFCDQKGNKN